MSLGFTARQLDPVTVTGAGTYYFTPQNVSLHEKICFQYEIRSASSLAGTVSFEFRTSATAAWMPFQTSGTTYTHTFSVATIAIQGSVGKLTFTSKSPSSSGSEIVVKLANTATAGAETVSVATDATTQVTTVTVGIQSGVSTAAQIRTAMMANATANALLTIVATTPGAMEVASAQLVGGGALIDIETAAGMVRMRANVTAGNAVLVAHFGAKT
jgi:hypothetical protein